MKVSSWILIVPAILAIGSTARAEFLTKWGSFGSGDGQFNGPRAVAVDGSGNVYVADQGNARIQKFDRNGAFLTKWGSAGTGDGQFYQASGVAVDGSGNVFVIDGAGNVQKFDGNGTFLTKWGSPGLGDGQFATPMGVAVDAAGNVYVGDFAGRVQKFDGNGNFLLKWQAYGSRGVAVDASGNVYTVAGSTSSNNRVDKYDGSGNSLAFWGSPGCGDGQFDTPTSVAVDASGNVYVTDMNNHRVQKFTSAGAFITKWGGQGSGDGQFAWPTGIAVDGSQNVYVCDLNSQVQKFGLGIGVGGGECVVLPPVVLSPEEQIAGMGDAVQALVTGGVLLPAQGNSLLTKLSAATNLLAQGNTNGAIAKLNDLVKQVSTFIKTGKLTSKQGQPLIEAAQSLIVELGGTLSTRVFSASAGFARDADLSGTAVPFRLYPGSFDAVRGTLTLRFDLPRASGVTLELYDIAGRRIEEARLGSMGPGRQEYSWTPRNHPSGLLFYRLKAGDLVGTGKVASVN